MFCLKNTLADQNAYWLEFSGPSLRFNVTYMRVDRCELRLVQEFLVSDQQPTRSQTSLSSLSGRSHVNA